MQESLLTSHVKQMPDRINNDFAVSLSDVTFSYSQDILYEEFSLTIEQSGSVAVLGASGSGKSTLGKMLAGIVEPRVGLRQVHGSFTHRADVVYIDQSPINGILPWQRVRRNLEYPLQRLGWPWSRVAVRVDELLSRFRIAHLADAYPARLSGGELQRVSLARNLSWSPKLAILDETFSSLDIKVRAEVIDAVKKLSAEEGMSVVLITHNLADAFALSTRCIVLGGRPIQVLRDLQTHDLSRREDNLESLLADAIHQGFL